MMRLRTGVIYEGTVAKSKLRQDEGKFERERQKRESIAVLRGAFRLMGPDTGGSPRRASP